MAERHGAAVLALGDQVEGGAEVVRQPLALALVDTQQAKRAGQLGQVIGRWRDHEEAATRTQDAAQLRAVARSEHVQDDVRGSIGDRQRPPGVTADRADPGVRSRRPPQRVPGRVERQAGQPRQAVKHGGKVVAGARAGVEHAAGFA